VWHRKHPGDRVLAEAALHQLARGEAGAPSLAVPRDRDDQQAEDEQHRKEQVDDRPDVGVGDDAGEHLELQHGEAEERRRREDHAQPTETIDRNRPDEVELGPEHGHSSMKNLA